MATPQTMRAMILEKAKYPLVNKEVPVPVPGTGEVLIKIMACGVCRTDLHVVDGELPGPKLPLIPGHEIVGRVAETGPGVTMLKINDLVGVPWLGYTCGHCKYCLQGKENLCDNAKFTGYTLNGGYAEYTVANERFCFLLPENLNDPSAAPLLCAGLIGFRSYAMINHEARNIGIYGFGAAAHIITQIAVKQGKKIFAFTRTGDTDAQTFAIKMGAAWAGNSDDTPPEKLEGAIILAPVGELVPKALKAVDKGGQVICGGIHMSDIPSFAYELLWLERSIKSVANLTRKDGTDFFDILNTTPVHTQTTLFKLEQANEALNKLRDGKINGAAVLVMERA